LRLRSLSISVGALVATLLSAAPAIAAPPQPDPDVAPPSPTTTPTDAPDATPAATPDAPATTDTPAPPPSGPAPGEQRFAPAPNLQKNPIDVLPGDVVYPPKLARPSKPVLWSPEWPRFSTADWVVTGTAAAITIAAAIIPPQPTHRFGGVLIDDEARRVLRYPTTEGRYVARDASDVILSLAATWPLFVDALITTWWFRASPDAAGQMALIDAQALSIVTAIQGTTNGIASRQRPYGQICGTPEQPQSTIDCEGSVRYRSFFSGHAAFTFMSAGLICVHHMKLGLLGSPGDVLSCVLAYTGAAATATLRVVGDMHYVSDVTVGAAFGTLVGLAVPLWHYRTVNPAPQGNNGVQMTVIPVGAGLGLGGTF
jgi:membrane-associated phospholipid phosphatase